MRRRIAEQVPRLRRRRDLVLTEQRAGVSRRWVVKDPVSAKYFMLSGSERFLLDQFDGLRSYGQIQAAFESQFRPLRLRIEQIAEYAARLHDQGLLISDHPGQGVVLRDRGQRQGWEEFRQSFANPLALRFRGVDATKFIDAVYPVGRLLFHPLAAAVFACFGFVAAVLLFGQFDLVAERLPDLAAFLSGRNLVLLMISLMFVKVLHELGHAVACRRLGGECNEIGVMLLAFTPCLYCNVSDAWTFSNRWHRILVSFAGIYVELALAAVATVLWFFSEPGVINALLFNTMTVCTVGTVLLNGNPLLRYDGYFILADYLEVPNLAEQSRGAVVDPVTQWFKKERRRPTEVDGNIGLLWTYGVLSMAYRWFVVAVILWGMHHLLKPLHLEWMVVGLAMMTVVSMVWPSLQKIWKVWNSPVELGVDTMRLRLCAVAVAVVVAVLVWLPIPGSIRVPLLAQSDASRDVYCGVDGWLEWSKSYGERVDKGAPVARLKNAKMQQELIELRGQVAYLRRTLESTRKQANVDPALLSQLPTMEAALQGGEESLRELEAKQVALTIVAPASGILSSVALPVAEDSRPLDSFPERPALHPNSKSRYLLRGEVIATVAADDRAGAQAYVSQDDIELVREGADVRVLLSQFPSDVFDAEVTAVSASTVKHVPLAIVSGGEIPVGNVLKDGAEPTVPTYIVSLKLYDVPQTLRHGTAGVCRIETQSRTIAWRLSRLINQTFRFRL